MEALEDSVLNLTHTRSSNRSRKQSKKRQKAKKRLLTLWINGTFHSFNFFLRSSCDVEEARVSLPPKIRSRPHEVCSINVSKEPWKFWILNLKTQDLF